MNTKLLSLLFIVTFSFSDIQCIIFTEGIKEDIYNIYKGLAVHGRDVTKNPFAPEKVRFFAFTREHRNEPHQIDPHKPAELANPNVHIAFIIHGWLENKDVQWYQDLKDVLLNQDEEYYVVQVDWHELANDIYAISAYSTKDVGGYIGELIAGLIKEHSVPIQNILVIGHSLGGQTAGFVGKKVADLVGEKLPRIVALDPAGPAFINRPEAQRLNPKDAKVVDVIHTDGGVFGFKEPCGTIDFFPNGGSHQPGCLRVDLLDPTSTDVFCDHHRSWGYFIEALSHKDQFMGKKCSGWKEFEANLCDAVEVAMGDLKTTETGHFYLETSGEKPFWKTVKKPGVEDGWNLVSSRFERFLPF